MSYGTYRFWKLVTRLIRSLHSCFAGPRPSTAYMLSYVEYFSEWKWDPPKKRHSCQSPHGLNSPRKISVGSAVFPENSMGSWFDALIRAFDSLPSPTNCFHCQPHLFQSGTSLISCRRTALLFSDIPLLCGRFVRPRGYSFSSLKISRILNRGLQRVLRTIWWENK